jgi:DNA-binding transcriptional ArsR family regulator
MTVSSGTDLASIAALVGDPGRANMLAAMFDGRPLRATELAEIAGVTASTASGHLAKLVEGRLVTVETRGRERMFRLASADVAHMLEHMMVVAAGATDGARATPRVPSYLREARTCYDHLAGRLGVGLADSLLAMGAVILTKEICELTDGGRAILARLNLDVAQHPHSRRVFCRACLDWSERRPHIGGFLGHALQENLMQRAWIKPGAERRSIVITGAGRRGLTEIFALHL